MRPMPVMAPHKRHEIAHCDGQTVLVIGSDVVARTGFVDLFECEGFRTIQVAGVEGATESLATSVVDLVVFDERLSGGKAFAFCRKLAVDGGAPVILLSDNADVISRIVALEVGADDLLQTPVDNRLLLAQARALMRRGDARSNLGVGRSAASGRWALDAVAREAIGPNGHRCRISPQEVSLMSMFLDNPGVLFTPETVTHWIPTFSNATTTGFRTAMSRLRRKLDELNCGEVIRTVHGAGYIYSAPGH